LAYDQGVVIHQATEKEQETMDNSYEARILREYRKQAKKYREAILAGESTEEESFRAFMLNAISSAISRSNGSERRNRLFNGMIDIDLELAEEGRGQ
jgi:hypothetical protein